MQRRHYHNTVCVMFFLAFSVFSSDGGLAGVFAMPQSSSPHLQAPSIVQDQLVELPDSDLLVEAGVAAGAPLEVEELVLADNGGFSHIKVHNVPLDISPAFDFDAAVAASLGVRDRQAAERGLQEQSLQAALTALEEGAALNMSTPRDGHCLFHALHRGGLLADIPGKLTIHEIRNIALSLATPEQLEVAAASTLGGMSVEKYREEMATSAWGGQLDDRSLGAWFPSGYFCCCGSHLQNVSR